MGGGWGQESWEAVWVEDWGWEGGRWGVLGAGGGGVGVVGGDRTVGGGAVVGGIGIRGEAAGGRVKRGGGGGSG